MPMKSASFFSQNHHFLNFGPSDVVERLPWSIQIGPYDRSRSLHAIDPERSTRSIQIDPRDRSRSIHMIDPDRSRSIHTIDPNRSTRSIHAVGPDRSTRSILSKPFLGRLGPTIATISTISTISSPNQLCKLWKINKVFETDSRIDRSITVWSVATTLESQT